MTSVREALAPVREALLDRARDDAERCLADAGAESAKLLDQARADAAEQLAAARASGAADADELADAELSRTRVTARGVVLSTQREAYEELRRRAIASLRDRAELRPVLAARATAALGGRPTVRDAAGGGVTGERDGRWVDCTVAALVDHALDELAGHIPELWS